MVTGHRYGHGHSHSSSTSSSRSGRYGRSSHTVYYRNPGLLGNFLGHVNNLAHGLLNAAGEAVTGTEQAVTHVARTVTAGIPVVNNVVNKVANIADGATTNVAQAAANTVQTLVVGATDTADALTGGGVVGVHHTGYPHYHSSSSSSSDGYHH